MRSEMYWADLASRFLSNCNEPLIKYLLPPEKMSELDQPASPEQRRYHLFVVSTLSRYSS
jgi:hypothetical protein